MSTTAISLRDDQRTFDNWQVAALAHMGVQGASDADLAIFFHECRRTGLDPFARQIHMIGRNTKDPKTDRWVTKFTIQTGIDGYRLIADRADKADGGSREYEDTQWCGPDGRWVDVWTADESPVAARVVVLRNGRRFPAVARYKAYVQTKRDGSPNSIWSSRDAEQLEKCAEALALRKAYPRDLSGIYTDAEMAKASERPIEVEHAAAAPRATAQTFAPVDVQDAEGVTDDAPEGITQPQMRKLQASFKDAGITDRDQRLAYSRNAIGREITSSKDLTAREASVVIEMLAADAQASDGTLGVQA